MGGSVRRSRTARKTARQIEEFVGGVPELAQLVQGAKPFKGSFRRKSSALIWESSSSRSQ